jgi:hypothetical protein
VRSRVERSAPWRAWAVAGCLALTLPAFGAEDAVLPPAAQVQAAASEVAKDPDLGGHLRQRTLRLRPDEPREDRKTDPGGLGWAREFVRWLVASARVLVWVAGAAAVAFVLVGLRHWIKVRADAALPRRQALPSHVQSLDIRPESLPADIGAAAAALWNAGDARAALSLLYRGALSRLVHDHALPIRAASTEGECVQLAARRLDAARSAFFGRLVGAWQLAVYGARLPPGDTALALCRDFDTHFARPPARGPA